MPTGVRLQDMVADLRHEIGHSTNPAHGTNTEANLKYRLRKAQQELHIHHDWAHLRFDADVPTVAQQRFYDFDSNMPFEVINHAWVSNGTEWLPLGYDITPRMLAVYNSEKGVVSWPPKNWKLNVDPSDGPNDGQFELWPVPNKSGEKIRFRGTRELKPFVDNDDVSTLDDQVIILTAAAKILKRQKQDDADDVAAEAGRVLNRLLTQGGSDKRPVFAMGQGEPVRRPRYGIDYMPLAP